jgi:hypothetical protein
MPKVGLFGFTVGNSFWQRLTHHPNYEEFWQQRRILPHLANQDNPIRIDVMNAGGCFDAEDLCGPLNIYLVLQPVIDPAPAREFITNI